MTSQEQKSPPAYLQKFHSTAPAAWTCYHGSMCISRQLVLPAEEVGATRMAQQVFLCLGSSALHNVFCLYCHYIAFNTNWAILRSQT